jgi:hypothetical protein
MAFQLHAQSISHLAQLVDVPIQPMDLSVIAIFALAGAGGQIFSQELHMAPPYVLCPI